MNKQEKIDVFNIVMVAVTDHCNDLDMIGRDVDTFQSAVSHALAVFFQPGVHVDKGVIFDFYEKWGDHIFVDDHIETDKKAQEWVDNESESTLVREDDVKTLLDICVNGFRGKLRGRLQPKDVIAICDDVVSDLKNKWIRNDRHLERFSYEFNFEGVDMSCIKSSKSRNVCPGSLSLLITNQEAVRAEARFEGYLSTCDSIVIDRVEYPMLKGCEKPIPAGTYYTQEFLQDCYGKDIDPRLPKGDSKEVRDVRAKQRGDMMKAVDDLPRDATIELTVTYKKTMR
jgi:hypothetical protein